MKTPICLEGIYVGAALMLFLLGSTANAQVASIYGGSDGLCGHRTANGERLNCGAMTAAHRRLPFGTLVHVCHSGCATVRINDRGPWVQILIYPRQQPEQSVCLIRGTSLFRECKNCRER